MRKFLGAIMVAVVLAIGTSACSSPLGPTDDITDVGQDPNAGISTQVGQDPNA
jgi:hypothetical protein